MNSHDEDKTDELSHTSRRTFCSGLMLTSAELVLAGSHLSPAEAAQDSVVAYPPRSQSGIVVDDP